LIKGVTGAYGKSISHPRIDAPVIKDLVGDKTIEPGSADFEWMLDLEPVAIPCGVNLRMANAALKKVSIAQDKTVVNGTADGGCE